MIRTGRDLISVRMKFPLPLWGDQWNVVNVSTDRWSRFFARRA